MPRIEKSKSASAAKRLPAIITASEASSWESCRVITPNLLSAYRLAFGESGYLIFDYPERICEETSEFRGAGLLEVAKQIRSADPDRLIFLDHSPHPFPLLQALALVYDAHPLPAMFFHIFGDFTLKAKWWKESENILKKTSVVFVCASGRQANMIATFLALPGRGIDVCPFPVDVEHYRPVESLREETRAKLGLKPAEFAIVYSGRMSLQKNVEPTIREIALFMERSGVPTRLFLAGRFDDIGAPLFGVRHSTGQSFQAYQSMRASLPNAVRDRVTYLGHYSSEELLQLYNAADCFVSLSLHHDEDFGMSPAEALSCGTPLILTSWGGFSGFVTTEASDCRLIPVRIAPYGGLEVHWSIFHRALFLQSCLQVETTSAANAQTIRLARAQRHASKVSLQSAAQIVKGIHNKSGEVFGGFNETFSELADHTESFTPYPGGPANGSLYEAVYSPYLGLN